MTSDRSSHSIRLGELSACLEIDIGLKIHSYGNPSKLSELAFETLNPHVTNLSVELMSVVCGNVMHDDNTAAWVYIILYFHSTK